MKTLFSLRSGTLEMIALDQPVEGFRRYICAWLYHGSEGAFVIDPGPASTIPLLIGELNKRDVKALDWILITHIHIDHAGGLGEMHEHYPGARVAVHPKGARHLIDPAHLNAASRAVLGDLMDAYGDQRPVPAWCVLSPDRIPFGSGIEVIPTPGHAPHHQCFQFEGVFFCGENLGIHVPLKEGLYIRPSTPPKFYLDQYLDSLKAMGAYSGPVCLGHFGALPELAPAIERSREQHLLWSKVLEDFKGGGEPDFKALTARLLEADPLFANLRKLPKDIQKREERLLKNSLRGFLGYLEGN